MPSTSTNSTRRSENLGCNAISSDSTRGELSSQQNRQAIDPALELTVSDQCWLIGISRSTFYRQGVAEESPENLAMMELIDRLYLAHLEKCSRIVVGALARMDYEVDPTADGNWLARAPEHDHDCGH